MCTPTNKPPNLHKFGNVVCFTLYIFKVVKMPPSYMDISNVFNKYGHKVWNVVLVFLSRIFTSSHHTSLSTFSSSTAKNKGHNTRKKLFFSIVPFLYFENFPTTLTHTYERHVLFLKRM